MKVINVGKTTSELTSGHAPLDCIGDKIMFVIIKNPFVCYWKKGEK